MCVIVCMFPLGCLLWLQVWFQQGMLKVAHLGSLQRIVSVCMCVCNCGLLKKKSEQISLKMRMKKKLWILELRLTFLMEIYLIKVILYL